MPSLRPDQYASAIVKMLIMMGIVAMVACGQASCMAPRKSEDTGKVRVLFIGEPLTNSFGVMKSDPLLDPTPVVAFDLLWDDVTIRKWIRQYMPRNYQELIRDYDVISLQWATQSYFDTFYKKWFSDAITNEGLGLFFVGVGFSYKWWFDTTVADVLPIEPVSQTDSMSITAQCRPIIRVLEPEHPLMDSVPWDSIGRYGLFPIFNLVKSKTGSETLAEVNICGQEHPFLVWWDVGEGRSLTMTSSYDWGWQEFRVWEYWPDWEINLHLFCANQPIPPDPELLHSLRKGLGKIRIERGLLVSMIEFASAWGANPEGVWAMLSKADDKLREAERRYLEQDFDASMTLTTDILTDLEEANKAALQLKNETLFWVYITEWLALLGTSMITGALVWGLMIKRRLYKEVETTMLRKAPS